MTGKNVSNTKEASQVLKQEFLSLVSVLMRGDLEFVIFNAFKWLLWGGI